MNVAWGRFKSPTKTNKNAEKVLFDTGPYNWSGNIKTVKFQPRTNVAYRVSFWSPAKTKQNAEKILFVTEPCSPDKWSGSIKP